jgi:hypothetical protein
MANLRSFNVFAKFKPLPKPSAEQIKSNYWRLLEWRLVAVILKSLLFLFCFIVILNKNLILSFYPNSQFINIYSYSPFKFIPYLNYQIIYYIK